MAQRAQDHVQAGHEGGERVHVQGLSRGPHARQPAVPVSACVGDSGAVADGALLAGALLAGCCWSTAQLGRGKRGFGRTLALAVFVVLTGEPSCGCLCRSCASRATQPTPTRHQGPVRGLPAPAPARERHPRQDPGVYEGDRRCDAVVRSTLGRGGPYRGSRPRPGLVPGAYAPPLHTPYSPAAAPPRPPPLPWRCGGWWDGEWGGWGTCWLGGMRWAWLVARGTWA